MNQTVSVGRAEKLPERVKFFAPNINTLNDPYPKKVNTQATQSRGKKKATGKYTGSKL